MLTQGSNSFNDVVNESMGNNSGADETAQLEAEILEALHNHNNQKSTSSFKDEVIEEAEVINDNNQDKEKGSKESFNENFASLIKSEYVIIVFDMIMSRAISTTLRMGFNYDCSPKDFAMSKNDIKAIEPIADEFIKTYMNLDKLTTGQLMALSLTVVYTFSIVNYFGNNPKKRNTKGADKANGSKSSNNYSNGKTSSSNHPTEAAPFGYEADGTTPKAPYGYKVDGTPKLSNKGRKPNR